MTDDNNIARCHECKRPLTVIDYHSEHRTGCMTCNLWGPAGGSGCPKRIFANSIDQYEVLGSRRPI